MQRIIRDTEENIDIPFIHMHLYIWLYVCINGDDEIAIKYVLLTWVQWSQGIQYPGYMGMAKPSLGPCMNVMNYWSLCNTSKYRDYRQQFSLPRCLQQKIVPHRDILSRLSKLPTLFMCTQWTCLLYSIV